MRRRALIFATILLLEGTHAALRADTVAVSPERVEVPVMRTSIYVGSVTLSTGVFTRSGEVFTATYEAHVIPWTVGSEKGNITINVPATELEKLLRGETVELTGKALNNKGRTHPVTAKAQPAESLAGRLKVRVDVSGTLLIFNGTYRFTEP